MKHVIYSRWLFKTETHRLHHFFRLQAFCINEYASKCQKVQTENGMLNKYHSKEFIFSILDRNFFYFNVSIQSWSRIYTHLEKGLVEKAKTETENSINN